MIVTLNFQPGNKKQGIRTYEHLFHIRIEMPILPIAVHPDDIRSRGGTAGVLPDM